MLRSNKGFTLIEVIVVIVILGILSAVAVPKIIGNIDDAKVNTLKQNLEIIKTAINTSYAAGTITALPTNDAGVNALLSGRNLASMAIGYTVSGTTYTLTAVANGTVSVGTPAGNVVSVYNLKDAIATDTTKFPAGTYTLGGAANARTIAISVTPE